MRIALPKESSLRLTILGSVCLCLWAPPALAQTDTAKPDEASQDEITELRQEVAELRALVSELLAAKRSEQSQRPIVPEDTVPTSQPLVQLGEVQRDSADSPSEPGAESEQQRLASVLSSRQPIGRFPDDAFVTSGDFERSISIPGTPGSFRIGGLVQVNANFDPDSLGFQQIGTQPTIPLDGDVEDGRDQFAIHVRHSRVNFDYRAPTALGDLRTFIEFDFFGDGDEFTNDYDLRLRHAAVELGNLKVGQFWSGFVDVFSFPETVDPGGPLSAPVLRNPGIYYVEGDRDGSNWGIGIENPAGDLGGETDLIASESLPNLVAFAKIQRDWGYLRLAGIGLQLESDTDSEFAGGAHLSGRIYTPFTGSKLNSLSFATQYGAGFTHYFSSFVGGLDGVIAEDGTVDATEILGAFGGYQHFWTDRWRSTITASFFELDSPDGADSLSYAGGERFSANLFYTPIDGATFGVEGIYNTIETLDGSEGSGVRIEVLGRFDF
ncbi:MAG: DcaP family trimeric outer membrane transporter [Pseudomonadota bacterium]